MAIAPTVRDYLEGRHIHYHLLAHAYAGGGMWTAETAHIPGRQLAKAVLLEDDDGYVLAVLPAHQHVDLALIHRLTGRMLGLATGGEVSNLFPDCESGSALPALGAAYGIETIVDEALVGSGEVFIGAGDHDHLVGLSARDFAALSTTARHLPIGRDIPEHH